jgi:hypothetical protein
MHKRFIVLLGMFLGSYAPAAAQAPAPQIVIAQEHVAPIITMLRTVSTPLSALSFPLAQDHGQPTARFSLLFAGAYERDHSLEPLPPLEEVKNLILKLSSLPLVQFWGGRLQLDAFQSTLHSQNVQLGHLGYGGMQGFRPPAQGYPGGPRSPRLTLSFHFGRDARTGNPAEAWRSLSRIVGTVLN